MQTWDVRRLIVTALRPSGAGGCWVAGQRTGFDEPAGHGLWHADPDGVLRLVGDSHVAVGYVYECPDRRVVATGRRSSEAFGVEPPAPHGPAVGTLARAFLLRHPWACRFDPYGAYRCLFVRRGTPKYLPVLEGFRTHSEAPQGFACRDGVALVGLWGRATDDGQLRPTQLVIARFDSTLDKAAAPAVFPQPDVHPYIADNVFYRWTPVVDGLLLRGSGVPTRLFGWDGQMKPLGNMLRHLPEGRAACDVRSDLAVAGGAVDLVWRRRGDKRPTRFGVKSRSKDQEKVGRVALSHDGLTAWFERGGTLYAIDME